MPFSVYILYSPSSDRFYRGQTSDLNDRMRRHNAGAESSTTAGKPWVLLWHTLKINRSQAIMLEKKLKNLSRQRLLTFIEKYPDDIASQQARGIIQSLVARG